jgi:hypothetical protein
VEDGNWVTSRQPSDIPAFNQAMIRLFSRSLVAGQRRGFSTGMSHFARLPGYQGAMPLALQGHGF